MRRWIVRLATRLGLVLAGVALALSFAEILVRQLPDEAPVAASAPAPRSDLRVLKSIYELATPGTEGIYQGAYYRSNSAGFRGPEFAREPDPGVFRIVAVGDSFVMGEGVLLEEAYSSVLERELRAAWPKRSIEVLNLGLSGLNIHHVVERLEGLGLSFHPDLIVYGVTSNDIQVEGYRLSTSGETIIAQRERYGRFAESRSRLLRLLWPRWVSFRDGMHPPRGTYMYEVFDNYLRNPEVWANYCSGFDDLKRLQDDTGVPVVVFIHPVLAYTRAFHPFGEVYDRIEEAARSRGLTVVQAYPSVAGRQAEALWISRANPHPNAEAHRLFGELLARKLIEMPALFESAS